jgi:hypothetical protein
MYGFKPGAKERLNSKLKSLFGKDARVLIVGHRPTPLECNTVPYPKGVYVVDVVVNDVYIGESHAYHWRKAYDKFVVELEKISHDVIEEVKLAQ